jgi:hypothetical protein
MINDKIIHKISQPNSNNNDTNPIKRDLIIIDEVMKSFLFAKHKAKKTIVINITKKGRDVFSLVESLLFMDTINIQKTVARIITKQFLALITLSFFSL